MSFADWSPSHLILVAFAVVAFIGHVAVMFYRMGQSEKRQEKQVATFLHAIERLEERMDKRFVEVNQQIAGLRTEIASVRTEIAGVRTEMNQRLSDMQVEMSKLNQNHINHLTHHGQNPPRANDS